MFGVRKLWEDEELLWTTALRLGRSEHAGRMWEIGLDFHGLDFISYYDDFTNVIPNGIRREENRIDSGTWITVLNS